MVGFKKLLHQALVVLGSGFNERLVHGFCFFLFRIGNFRERRLAAIGSPRELLHQDDVNQGIEARTCFNGILNRNHLRAVNAAQLFQYCIVVTFLIVQLVYQEDDRLSQFFGIAEVVLRAHFWAKLPIDQQTCRICHIQCRHSCPNEIIRSWAVDDIQLFVIPFHMKHR